MAKRSIAGIAGIVAVATLLSKVFGYVRQATILAAFGTGPVSDAFVAAYVVPSFILILLGGVNGPFHSAIVSAIAKRPKQEAAPIIETITTLSGLFFLAVAVILIIFSPAVVDAFVPGLRETDIGLSTTRPIAILMLRIMAPITIFASLIGIGFGSLNADDQYWLPSVSPLISSVVVVAGLGVLRVVLGDAIADPAYFMLGGIILASCTLLGALLQWLIQVPALAKSGLARLRLRLDLKNQGVRDVLKVLLPAALSSSTLKINTIVDLRFASFIPDSLAALDAAGLLVALPLGIISSLVLVPYFPIFSRLSEPTQWPELKRRIRQCLMLISLAMLPISAFTMVLAQPIVTIVYKRGAFDNDSVEIVTWLLMAYGAGLFAYLARDIMVRVFYALGDGTTPFRISTINIIVNVILDYILIQSLGVAGLIIATTIVNISEIATMVILLNRQLGGLPLMEWANTISMIFVASFISGLAAWFTQNGIANWTGTETFAANLIIVGLAGATGLATYAVLTTLVLKIPETKILTQRIQQKLGR